MKRPFELSPDTRDALQAATDAVLADVFGNAVREAEKRSRACGCQVIEGHLVERCRIHDEEAMRVVLLEDELAAARHAFRGPAWTSDRLVNDVITVKDLTGFSVHELEGLTLEPGRVVEIAADGSVLRRVRAILERHHVIDGPLAVEIVRELYVVVFGEADSPQG